jgi:glycosyltransferase involved in cell wall biosynthesis
MGLIVPPEDPEPVAAAIRRALSDDALVNRAAELNARVARERLDELVIRPQVIVMYKKIADKARTREERQEMCRL